MQVNCLLGHFLTRQTYCSAVFKSKSPLECHDFLTGITFFPRCSVLGLARYWDKNGRPYIFTERKTTVLLDQDLAPRCSKLKVISVPEALL